MPKFIPGLELSKGFHTDCVAPILARVFPDLTYAAALMGGGSEVLGLDTEMSRDHSWGPRLQIFLEPKHDVGFRNKVQDTLSANLPYEYMGYSTSFHTPNPREKFVTQMIQKTSGPVDHMVEITNFKLFTQRYLGFDASTAPSERQWLSAPGHQLLVTTSGEIFVDQIGLTEQRGAISWYPRDVWLFLLGCIWWRIRRAEQVVGRVGLLEDELGASIIAARIVNDLMRLAFMMEKEYEPYSKWLGTLFGELEIAQVLGPQLTDVMNAKGWMERDRALIAAYETVAAMHNELGVTAPIPPECEEFRGRGFHVIVADRFARTLFMEVKSRYLSGMFRKGVLGNIDLVTDHVDMNLSAVEDGPILKIFE